MERISGQVRALLMKWVTGCRRSDLVEAKHVGTRASWSTPTGRRADGCSAGAPAGA
jgi:hypothetical protein